MATIIERERKDGSKTYQAKIRLKGCAPQSATFDRKTDARKWIQDTESAMRNGRHFKTSEAKRRTMAELIDRYIKDVLPNKSTKAKQDKNQQTQMLWWKEQIGHVTLADVTPTLLAECRDNFLNTPLGNGKRRAPATVVRYMAVLSHAFTMAVNEWGWLEDSPMRKVRKPVEARGRVRFLSEEERKALLDACRNSTCPYLYPVVVLALSTGMRKGEIMTLRWQDVDFSRGLISLHETKNGERRAVPLVGHALEELRKLGKVRNLHSPFIFPASERGQSDRPFDIHAPWQRALKEAKLEDFRFHDLRHSAASYLAMNGASLAEIAEVLGHKTLQMVKRYAHLSEAHTSAVVAKMNERIFS